MKWENTLTFKSSFLQRLLLDKTFTFTFTRLFVQNGGDAEIFKTNKKCWNVEMSKYNTSKCFCSMSAVVGRFVPKKLKLISQQTVLPDRLNKK